MQVAKDLLDKVSKFVHPTSTTSVAETLYNEFNEYAQKCSGGYRTSMSHVASNNGKKEFEVNMRTEVGGCTFAYEFRLTDQNKFMYKKYDGRTASEKEIIGDDQTPDANQIRIDDFYKLFNTDANYVYANWNDGYGRTRNNELGNR
jgi:hypothetical protein